jgi:hypothetical protein
MRHIRNVMARLRLKLREVDLDTINVHETDYMLIKNLKWPAPRCEKLPRWERRTARTVI